MTNKATKEQKIKHVLDICVKNLTESLYLELKKEILDNSELRNKRQIEKYVKARLKLKSYAITSYNYWICRGWTQDEADIKRIKFKNDNSPMTILHWTKKINPDTGINYTEQEAQFKIKSQRKLNVEYWINKGYSQEDAKIEVSKYQKETVNVFTTNMKLNPELYTDRTATQLGYWIKKEGNIEEATKSLKNRQNTLSLDKTILKYGTEIGTELYKTRCKNNGYRNTLKYYIEKHGEVVGRDKFTKRQIRHNVYRASKQSYLFFIPIYKYLRSNGIEISDIFWGVGKSKEYFLYSKFSKSITFYDFTVPKLNLILEFHGVGFHPNPEWSHDKWDSWRCLYTKENADVKYKHDQNKKHAAIDRNYDCVEIYSDVDKKQKQQEIINIIKDKIYGN